MNKSKTISNSIEWTHSLAYIVGLLLTDGNLSKDGRHIIMRSSDIDLLKTFKDCLSLKDKIAISKNDGYAKKPSYRIQFSNVKFYKWLLEIGLFSNKTYTIGEIKIPNKFFKDFLRGHLDGDGSIIAYNDKNNHYKGRTYINKRLYVKFISVSEKHILWLHKKIQELVKIKGSLTSTKPKTNNRVPMWTIKFAKNDSIKLLNWIYYQLELPCLSRKMLLAKTCIEQIENEKKGKYTKILSLPKT